MTSRPIGEATNVDVQEGKRSLAVIELERIHDAWDMRRRKKTSSSNVNAKPSQQGSDKRLLIVSSWWSSSRKREKAMEVDEMILPKDTVH